MKNENKQQKHIIFGAGSLGVAVATELLNQGKDVLIVSRSGKVLGNGSFKVVAGDAKDAKDIMGAKNICKDAVVIYNCIGIPYSQWQVQFPAIISGLIDTAAEFGAVLVHADNLYAYGPVDGIITEDTMYNPVGVKTAVRGQMASMIMEAHKAGRIKATIGRAPDFYGPGVRTSTLGKQVFENILTGKKAMLLGDIKKKHAYIYIEDFAKGLITLAENELAYGEIWHIPFAKTITTKEIVDMIFVETDKQPAYSIANRLILSIISFFKKDMNELKELYYQFEKPFEVDYSKFENAFGYNVTPHEVAIQKTIQWYREMMK